MNVPPLTFRLDKGSPLNSEENDENFRLLRDFCDGLGRLFELVFNANGTLKTNSVSTDAIQDRAVTQRKLDWLANFFCVAAGVDNYTATISPTTGFTVASYGDGATTAFILPILFTNANTGSCDLAINGAAAKAIKKRDGTNLVAGEIGAGHIHILCYDGTEFQILTPVVVVAPQGIPNFLAAPDEVFNDVTAPDWTRFDASTVPETATALILTCSWSKDGPTDPTPSNPKVLIRSKSGEAEYDFVTSSAFDGDDHNTNQGLFPCFVVAGVTGFDYKIVEGFDACVIQVVGYIS